VCGQVVDDLLQRCHIPLRAPYLHVLDCSGQNLELLVLLLFQPVGEPRLVRAIDSKS
jgi:hypothetical protein